MKKITIQTTFRDADPAYSLNRIVKGQIQMLLDNGYQPIIIVAKGFKPIEEYAKVKCVEIPDVPVSNDITIDKTFDEDIKELKKVFLPILQETDVMITHDLVYQPAALKHNIAVRELLRDNDVSTKFLHWVHSAAQPAMVQQIRGGGQPYLDIVNMPFPNSLYITFNEYSTPRIASWFGITEDKVKYVPHPHNFYEFWHKDAIRIAEKGNLLQKDVIIIYPVRLDRGKQVEYVIKIASAVKKTGRSVGAVIMDFHSLGGDKVDYRQELQTLALNLGLSETECFFTSEIDGKDKMISSFSNQVVSNLFEIANTFILPSKSETYSLIAQEAAVKRNFCILNFDFPPMRSIYGEAPLYRKFSSNIDIASGMDGGTATKYNIEDNYMSDIAKYINYVQENTRVLALSNMIRQNRNLQTVFKRHIEPLLFAESRFNY